MTRSHKQHNIRCGYTSSDELYVKWKRKKDRRAYRTNYRNYFGNFDKSNFISLIDNAEDLIIKKSKPKRTIRSCGFCAAHSKRYVSKIDVTDGYNNYKFFKKEILKEKRHFKIKKREIKLQNLQKGKTKKTIKKILKKMREELNLKGILKDEEKSFQQYFTKTTDYKRIDDCYYLNFDCYSSSDNSDDENDNNQQVNDNYYDYSTTRYVNERNRRIRNRKLKENKEQKGYIYFNDKKLTNELEELLLCDEFSCSSSNDNNNEEEIKLDNEEEQLVRFQKKKKMKRRKKKTTEKKEEFLIKDRSIIELEGYKEKKSLYCFKFYRQTIGK